MSRTLNSYPNQIFLLPLTLNSHLSKPSFFPSFRQNVLDFIKNLINRILTTFSPYNISVSTFWLDLDLLLLSPAFSARSPAASFDTNPIAFSSPNFSLYRCLGKSLLFLRILASFATIIYTIAPSAIHTWSGTIRAIAINTSAVSNSQLFVSELSKHILSTRNSILPTSKVDLRLEIWDRKFEISFPASTKCLN